MSFQTFVLATGGVSFLFGLLFGALSGQTTLRILLFAVATAGLFLSVRTIRRTIGRQSASALQNPLTIKAQGLFDDLFDPMLNGLIRLLREKNEVSGRLAEVASRFEGVLEHMVEGVAVTSPNAQILLVNAAFERILEVSSTEAVGNRLGLVIRDVAIHQLVEEVFRTRAKVLREIEFSGGGKKKTLSVVATVSETRDGSGKSYGIFLFYDMTTIRGLERIRKDFVANVSHEIRTPLTSIRGYAEALTDGALYDPELARKFLGIISDQADRLSRMVNDLLELSRLESGTVELRLGEIELGVQTDRMQEVFSSRLRDRNMQLRADFPRPFRYISDESLIELVLTNLLDNAIKYSPPGREIRIFAEQNDGIVTIGVSDNGPGIPREELPRVFERFYRVDRSRSSNISGTGLGLSIVRHVATILKGRVEIKSDPGEGTTVSLHLPQKMLRATSFPGNS